MKLRSPLVLVVLIVTVFVLAGCGDGGDNNTNTSNEPTATCSPTSEQFDAYPAMDIDAEKKYAATFELVKGGSFEVELHADKAPKAVNSFVFLARKKYFDCVTFHRVLEGFMAQGGDPTGTGSGGPGYEFEYEDSGYSFDRAGVVAMANEAPATPTNGSQFFITFEPYPSLNGGYTVFGQVTKGMDVVNAITLRDPNSMPTNSGDLIKAVTISEK